MRLPIAVLLLGLAGCGSTPDPWVGTWLLTLDPTGGSCNNGDEWYDTLTVTGPPYYVTETGATASTAAGNTASASASSSGLRWVIHDTGSTYAFTMAADGTGTMQENRQISTSSSCTETWAVTGEH